MPDPSDPTKVQTRDDEHAQAAAYIGDQLKEAFDEDHQTMPPTDLPPKAGNEFTEMADRVVFNRPGYGSSKNFLKKMWERVQKKNPNSQVKLDK